MNPLKVVHTMKVGVRVPVAAAIIFTLAGCGGNLVAPSPGTGFTNAAATQIWLQQFGTGNTTNASPVVTPVTGLFNSGDILTGVATDNNGNIVVCGYTFGTFPNFFNPSRAAQGFVAEFSPVGQPLWLNQFSSGTSDFLNAVTTDSSGNVYAAGFNTQISGTTNTASPAAVVVAFNSTGNQLWVRQFTSQNAMSIGAIANDQNGGLLVAGVLSQTTNQNQNGQFQLTTQSSFVADLNATNGQTNWKQVVGQSGITVLNSIASDSSGDAFVAGETTATAPAGSLGGIQPLAMELSGIDGSTVWQQQVVGPRSAGGFLQGVAVDSHGNVYVSGYANAGTLSTNYIARLTGSAGQQAWSTSFGGSSPINLGNVAVDPTGNIYVVGTTPVAFLQQFTSSQDDVFLAKFNSGGTNVWLQQFGTGNEWNSTGTVLGLLPGQGLPQVTTDPSGNPVVGGITTGQFPGFTNSTQAIEPFVGKFGQ